MTDMSDPVWQQLGDALSRRRVELDPRYRNLALFARERGLNERLVSDIEHGRRGGYRKGTRTALEIAYGLGAGTIDRFIAGEVTSLTGGQVTAAPRYSDPALQHIWETPGTTEAVRLALVAAAIAMRELNDGAGSRSA
jgi:hypothetical protein